MTSIRITMRHEARGTEYRAPIVPADAARLVGHGIALTVEESPQRVFATADYADAGCAITAPGSWAAAPEDAFILGLKELPRLPAALRHRHVFFGHAYKGQRAGPGLLRRFAAGGGALLDLEYLADDAGRRLAAFGYWAGYAGAALAVLHHRRQLVPPLAPMSKDRLAAALRRPAGTSPPRVLIIGVLGRCGRGARDALAAAGIRPTCWDIAETRSLDLAALLSHDILVNAVNVTEPIPPFLTRETLRRLPRRLAVIADVTCDVASAGNVLPIYDRAGSWTEPVLRLGDAGLPLDVIAIENLPSLLPEQASVAFSAALTPHLMTLGGTARPWQRCVRAFRAACESNGLEGEFAHV